MSPSSTALKRPSVNRLAAPLVERLIQDAEQLRIVVERTESGALVVDAGIDCPGGIEAGRRIAEICMAGLGQVRIADSGRFRRWSWSINVGSTDPVLACLASQLAGWQLTHGEGKQAFFALGSGPGRALARKEPLFEHLGYTDNADSTCLVLEVDKRPPAALIEKAAADCGVAPDRLTLILTPTRSLAGTVQIVGRVLEVALHKVHQLGFSLDRVVDGLAAAPLPPPASSFITAMGRTNDAIIYGGSVHLFVTGPEADARKLAEAMPSSASRDYGKPFAEIFQAFKGNFYDIDPLLFSPARVTVTALESGNSIEAGVLDEALLDRSFGEVG
ncbi:MAG: methenyltetrahydromethanopterin cyclohydrolase [Rhodospirillaceae bacterium]|nr:methenyltetrahydromethanopterin cyclohydrolase [Rhodospirillaceae bacterium]